MALSASKLELQIKPPIKKAFEKIMLNGVEKDNFRKLNGDDNLVLDDDAYNQAKRESLALADDVAKSLAKDLAKEIVNHMMTASISSTILPNTIPTVGSPSAQVGPPALLTISGSLK